MKTKNNFKRSCAVILIMMVLSVSLSSCKNGNSSSKTSAEAIVDNRPAGYGNTPANICNTADAIQYIPGLFTQDENYVYYSFTGDDGKSALYKTDFDFKKKMLISNISCGSLNVLNNWIYYVNADDNSTVYKMDTDGQNNGKISDMQFVKNLMVISNKLYFISENEETDGIYVMDTDGNNLNQLTDLCVFRMYIHDNVIYFVGRPERQFGSEPYGIYKMNTDGTGQTFLLSAGHATISNLVIYNDYIYYGEMNDYVSKISVDGGEPEDVTAGIVEGEMGGLWGTINICNNTIYYSILHPYEGGIHSLNLDTNENKKLTPFPGKLANNIYIINNQIYFCQSENDITNYYRMNLDGSNLKKLWSR